MKLKQLFKEIPGVVIRGSKETLITGLSANSRLVSPGNLFVAKKGLSHDGARFIPEAVAAGAAAVLTDLYDPFLPAAVVQVIHPDTAALEAAIAVRYYRFPAETLSLVGVTGTNGKTTTTYLIKYLFDQLGIPSGLIGTVEWMVGSAILSSNCTTPDVITTHKLLYEMALAGCKAAVMEVSSHGLDQGRVEGLHFDTAVFTNLTQDHLDYHKTMERYGAAKALLFARSRRSVVNADDPFAVSLPHTLTYGIEHPADLRAKDIVFSPKETRFTLELQGRSWPVILPLIGRFNIYNCLAAFGAVHLQGLPLEEALHHLRSFKGVRGRLERVPNKKGLHIFVDYAHTPDALKNVLELLREIKKGKLVTVFGCGGDRDRTKRPKMGEVVEALSDIVLVTSDNPRSEDPSAIIAEIVSGFKRPDQALVEVDRAEAIRRAVRLAGPQDLVLIAGKGHETSQIFAHHTVDFDDRKMALLACAHSLH